MIGTARLLAVLLTAAVMVVAAPAAAGARQPSGPVPPLPDPMPWITRGPCPGWPDGTAAGCYYRPGTVLHGQTLPAGALFTDGPRTTAHELGHAFDATRMDASERQRFATLIGMPDTPWESRVAFAAGLVTLDPAGLEEAFADAYMACRMRDRDLWSIWFASLQVSPRMLRRVCVLIGDAAASPSP